MKGICVFWIPTIYHQDIRLLDDRQDVEGEDISDKVGSPCKLTLKLKEKNAIFVELFFEEEQRNLSFTLSKPEIHQNGLFAYSFEVNEDSFNIVKMALVNPVYHYVKGFYHKHQYHSTDCDSILNAYVTGDVDRIKLDCPDNIPLIFYLRQYEKRFKDFAEQLEFDAKYLEDLDKDADNKEVLYREKYEEFNQRCIDVLGEVIYYRSLLNSKYNYSYKHNPHEVRQHDCECGSDCPSKKELCGLYKSALNTENAITRIKLLADRVKSVYQSKRAHVTLTNIKMMYDVLQQLSETTSEIGGLSKSSLSLQQKVGNMIHQGEKTSKISKNLGYLGALLGGLSVVLAIVPFFLNGEAGEIQNAKNAILERMDNLELKVDSMVKQKAMILPSITDKPGGKKSQGGIL